ncbi:hypothetical protein [Pseudomonas sp. MAG002Y]|uniref:hypothetical protein n=1 Tax=Pseudomonas sp. MAG002Y TaxID=2678690 RepID=UPI001C608355|nr:hypothetical protein [Pseudomonas sp. MAG002Y]MBW5416299.1 hypothetical protein [Pseudomonas sp. MAG002Y]
MEIKIPDIQAQQKFIFEEATKEAIAALEANLKAPRIEPQSEIDESQYSNKHLLREKQGWEPPSPDIVAAYFRHFQKHFPEFDTDQKLADLLGISSNRRIREFKSGEAKVPYGVWRRFLVLTGRAPQEIIPVMAFMG